MYSTVTSLTTSQGRDGKGSIFIWAAGNGGANGDSCATDGYVGSIYTIAVGAMDQQGRPAYYDEKCSSKMAVTFNHNTRRRQHIVSSAIIVCGFCVLTLS